MRSYWFLALAALAVAAFSAVDLSAGCRAQCRRACRAARRCGVLFYAPQPTRVGGYPDQVQPVGSTGGASGTRAEARWECDGKRCKLVVPVKPVPDPQFKQVAEPPSEATQPTETVKPQALAEPVAREDVQASTGPELLRDPTNEPGEVVWFPPLPAGPVSEPPE